MNEAMKELHGSLMVGSQETGRDIVLLLLYNKGIF